MSSVFDSEFQEKVRREKKVENDSFNESAFANAELNSFMASERQKRSKHSPAQAARPSARQASPNATPFDGPLAFIKALHRSIASDTASMSIEDGLARLIVGFLEGVLFVLDYCQKAFQPLLNQAHSPQTEEEAETSFKEHKDGSWGEEHEIDNEKDGYDPSKSILNQFRSGSSRSEEESSLDEPEDEPRLSLGGRLGS